jgi:hypothetical protein
LGKWEVDVGSQLGLQSRRENREVGSGKWEVESGQWKVESGKWKMESGKWTVESGKWKVESGKWKMEKWKVESGEVGRRSGRRSGKWEGEMESGKWKAGSKEASGCTQLFLVINFQPGTKILMNPADIRTFIIQF